MSDVGLGGVSFLEIVIHFFKGLFGNIFVRGFFRIPLRGLVWWPVCKKILILCFCFFHLASVIWWLIPGKGFVKDHRFVDYPEHLKKLEDQMISFKRDKRLPEWAWQTLENYTFRTATWQSWWMFAPNPIDVQLYLTVKAVLGWKEESEIPKEKRIVKIWGDAREPIYDTVPIYKSYTAATVEEATRTFAGGYTDDHKLAENFPSGKWDRAIEAFANWAKRDYEEKTGIIAPGVHVLLSTVRIPTPFTGTRADQMPVSERVLWYLHELPEPQGVEVEEAPVKNSKKSRGRQ